MQEKEYNKEKKIHIANIVLSSIQPFSFVLLFLLIFPFSLLSPDSASPSHRSTVMVTILILVSLSYLALLITGFIFEIFGTIYASKRDLTIAIILYIVGFFVFPCTIIAAALSLSGLKKYKIENSKSDNTMQTDLSQT
ncbi:hypothetical protein [Metamycoplasma auris]|uniref:Transmembrane protein n=1 Tax=Metamycoplasma auris TaxID=51363 RepID=A0A2W7GPY2_9BACT|nr:hypothetical protein [Metamycoplasma auris]PZV99942.1 hypothetical protein BCF89_10420 [Metamycoplasma auris]